MLYRFILENYKSFRDRNEISFFPTNQSKYHVFGHSTSIPILGSTLIYGANASGKSNVVKALSFFKRLVIDNKTIFLSANDSYLLEKDYENKPSVFVIEAKIGGAVFQYGIAANLKHIQVLEEWLYVITSEKETEIFSRSKNSVEINPSFISDDNRNRYKVYVDDLDEHVLFLSDISSKKNIGSDYFGKSILSLYNWFKNLRIVFPNTRYNIIEDIVSDDKSVNKMYEKYFKKFGIDISGIHISPLDKIPDSFPEAMIDDIRKNLIMENSKKSVFIRDAVHNIDYLVKLNPNKEIVISDIRFEHKKNGRSIDFVKSDESDGTQRLFDLIPIINDAISNNRVVIVDEIDRSLHSSLTLDLFDTFYSMRKNNSRCQLICTTHDTSLMNLEFFRKEEIWFVEKEDQVSSLYSLDKFKLKDNIANVSANYLLGKYGSIPQINK